MATVSLDPSEYPANSNASKKEEAQKKKKKHKPVVTSPVAVGKPSLARKFKDAFVVEDIRVVIGEIINENVIPAIKDAISDAVTSLIDGLLYGSGGTRRKRKSSNNRGEPSYAAYYKSNGRSVRRSKSDDDDEYESNGKHDYRDFSMRTKAEADEVLSDLLDYIEEYEEACIADYLDLIDQPSDPQDNKWGWTNLSRARVKHGRDGYYIDFPRAEYLD